MLRAYKTELDPNNQQRTQFKQNADAARFVYNWGLADREAQYKVTGKSVSGYEQKKRFNALKKTAYPWLEGVCGRTSESAFMHLDVAFQNYWRQKKDGTVAKRKAEIQKAGKWGRHVSRLLQKGRQGIELDPGYPQFKSKHRSTPTFTLRGCIHIETDRIKLPVIGWVRLKERGYLPTEGVKILSANVSERAGRWYASVQVEEPDKPIEHGTGAPIGVDLGIKTLAVCSDGVVFENPHSLAKAERKLKRLSRELHRRQKGSKNRAKTQAKLAKCHAQVAHIRQHALHQVSHHVTAKTKPSTVVLEDLNVKGMVRNHSLAKAVSDASFSDLRQQIEYKASWNGVDVVVADRFYPSSKTCSACGVKKALLKLSERTFVCEECGAVVDRDLNAARNLAALA